MEIRDEIEALVLLLRRNGLAHGAEVVAQVKGAGGLDARQDAFVGDHLSVLFKGYIGNSPCGTKIVENNNITCFEESRGCSILSKVTFYGFFVGA